MSYLQPYLSKELLKQSTFKFSNHLDFKCYHQSLRIRSWYVTCIFKPDFANYLECRIVKLLPFVKIFPSQYFESLECFLKFLPILKIFSSQHLESLECFLKFLSFLKTFPFLQF